MNITDKIKLKVDLEELNVLVGITSVIPADSIDMQYRAIFSIMLKVNTKLRQRAVAHQFSRNPTNVSIGLDYHEAYALYSFLSSYHYKGNAYENNVILKTSHFIHEKL